MANPKRAIGTFRENTYQAFILDYLTTQQGWLKRTDANFDRALALDRELLVRFLKTTQGEEYDAIEKIYKDRTDKVIAETLNTHLVTHGLVSALKNGFQVENVRFSVLAPKPDAPYNKKAWSDYRANVFSVAEEVWASDAERIDLVLFLNGLPIFAVELKDNNAGQTCEDAKVQWKERRSPKTRLFFPQGGALVMFAADLEQVWMTTRLDGKATKFLPFNKGANAGDEEIDCGAGNPPPPPGKYAVSYLWEETFAKDSVIDLLTRFVFVEENGYTDEKGKRHFSQRVIFPRYHQIDVVKRLVADVGDNATRRNYLVQHSAGSGKTKSITWLAYRLASLFSGGTKPGEEKAFTFDHVIVMTDRRVVIHQLQAAVKQLENAPGYVKCINDGDPSSELLAALNAKKRIIATTIQRFGHIQDLVANRTERRFAVIIDEAHSSTKGKSMLAVRRVLGADFSPNDTPEELMHKLIAKQLKQKNVSIFAFTATPRAATIQLFGVHSGGGKKGVFHTYSMKQAIEEGFILDVLKNYAEYKTLYEIEKKVEGDPLLKQKKAKSAIHRFVMEEPRTVRERATAILDHFLGNYKGRLNGNAKAMVVTGSRREAVAYWEEIKAQLRARGEDHIKVLVAFSGALQHKGEKTTEARLNGFSEDVLPRKFCEAQNRILVVADKYQTGFDQPFLSFMYVLKKLRDIAAVQTLSRLNRIWPDGAKETFVVDFVNTAEDIGRAFAPYYRSTKLNNSASLDQLRQAALNIEGFDIFDLDTCNDYWTAICKDDEPNASRLLAKAVTRFGKLSEADQDECRSWLAKFDTLYPFVAQAVNLGETDFFLTDQFVHPLLGRLDHKPAEQPLDLRTLIDLKGVRVVRGENGSTTPGEDTGTNLPNPKPMARGIDLEERLSLIIREINSENGVDFEETGGAKRCLLIRDQLIGDKRLKKIANANTQEAFEQVAESQFEKFVTQAYTDSDEFFKYILGNKAARRLIFKGLARDIYRQLRGEKGCGIVAYEIPEPIRLEAAEPPPEYRAVSKAMGLKIAGTVPVKLSNCKGKDKEAML